MMVGTRCQAKKREECTHHGMPLHKKYIGQADPEEFLRQKEEENIKRRLQSGEDTPLKNLNAKELTDELIHLAGKEKWISEEILSESIDLASILHANQTRGNRGGFTNTPYIEHPLRNALRLMRLGVKDQDVIVGAVLHDTIEDGAKDYMEKIKGSVFEEEEEARTTLYQYIEKRYNTRTAEIVQAVTNDYITDTVKAAMSIDEKNSKYLNHVSESITNNPPVFLVKISDFIDNATGLHHNDVPERREKTKKQAAKYLPVTDVFIAELKNNSRIPITHEAKLKLIRSMLLTRERLTRIVSKEDA